MKGAMVANKRPTTSGKGASNLFDPVGIYAAWTDATERTVEQVREAQRQLKVASARADVDLAYSQFKSHSDAGAARNLASAVTGYLEIIRD
jgi:hypothetical protein